MSNTTELIRLLDAADTLPGARALRSRSYDLLRVEPGAIAVDVGCGAGRAVAELIERKAVAIGVDMDPEMVAAARDRWPGADFRVGDAYDLPLKAGEVAAYRADKVFHDLADAERALREAARVLATGGRIVLVGQDWDTFVIDSDDPQLTRTIVRTRADLTANPRAARRYRNLLLDTGYQDVEVEVHTGVFTEGTMLPMLTGIAHAARTAGAISPEQHDAWVAEQSQRARQGRLFLALPLFMASATWTGNSVGG
ncbi:MULTISPECIES: methyltransferase domain-containing protein [unclassified Nonomuraea]|uniref:methyltransferase domain-containing protein n=1 Tax=unclassified Nonomuraea TaxID=2593643 RepID=UPI0033C957DC